jgi:hypothetical protein
VHTPLLPHVCFFHFSDTCSLGSNGSTKILESLLSLIPFQRAHPALVLECYDHIMPEFWVCIQLYITSQLEKMALFKFWETITLTAFPKQRSIVEHTSSPLCWCGLHTFLQIRLTLTWRTLDSDLFLTKTCQSALSANSQNLKFLKGTENLLSMKH